MITVLLCGVAVTICQPSGPITVGATIITAASKYIIPHHWLGINFVRRTYNTHQVICFIGKILS